MLLDHSDSIYRRSSSCKHRIRHNDLSLFDPIRQLTEIFMRFMGLRISIKPDMTDLCKRNQCGNAIHHTKTCTKYRYDRQLLTCDHR